MTVRRLTAQTWSDFEQLFSKHKGVRGGCWCMYNRMRSAHFTKATKDARKQKHKALVETGKASGVLVYQDDVPIAWCQFGPAEGFPRFDYSKTYTSKELGTVTKKLWRISCLFVDKDYRRQGLSAIALSAALDLIREDGGGIVEAFPMVIEGAERPSYTGSLKMYEEHGFKQITQLGKITVLMRKEI